ncbi:MAG: Rod binding domain-containing protein [Phycisphaerales bacterium]|jgi:Rod binding domain-containing protein
MSGIGTIDSSRGFGAIADGFAAPRLVAGGSSADEQQAFGEILGLARGKNLDATPEQKRDEAREAAEKLVASTFIEPLLKSVRESSQAAAPFAPTQAEKQFRGLMDARVAESVVHRTDLAIVGRIADSLLRAAGLDEGSES